MTNNKENLLMDRDKQYTPLEREVSPKGAFTKAAIFTKFERDKIKKYVVNTIINRFNKHWHNKANSADRYHRVRGGQRPPSAHRTETQNNHKIRHL